MNRSARTALSALAVALLAAGALAGCATATVGGETLAVAAGDALIIPAGVPFSLANPYSEPFEAVAALPVGGRAAFADGEPFVPPWAA